MDVKNIFENIPEVLSEELIEELFSSPDLKIERIISEGHSSPEDFWYDQDKNEFVFLVSGSAELMFEDEKSIKLNPGDYLLIPAHKKHRVEKTDPTQKTFWLTVFY
jgi:cupin 2 domain-containing protein